MERDLTDDETDAEDFIRDVLAQFFFMRPGFVDSFDPDKNTATAIVAIQSKIIDREKARYITMPVIENVPVCIPYSFGAGTCLTVPIRPGDPCMLLFSDRMMDVFLRTGQFSPPEDGVGPDNIFTEPRMHNMADAVLIPGLIPQRVKGAASTIKDWNQDNIELRTADRSRFISLGADGIEINDGAAKATFQNGRVHVKAPQGFIVDAPNWRLGEDGAGWCGGIFTASDLKTDAGFAANSHRHRDVEPGNGTTGIFV